MRRRGAVALVVAAAGLLLATIAAPSALADHNPGVPDRVEGRAVYGGGLLSEGAAAALDNLSSLTLDLHGLEFLVVVQQNDSAAADPDEEAAGLAAAVAQDWELDRAVILALVARPNGCDAGAAIRMVGLDGSVGIDVTAIVTEDMRPAIERCDVDAAAIEGAVGIVRGLAGVELEPADATTAAPGPPFPPPVDNQAVYDTAGVFDPATIASAERTIDEIEARTGAEVVVYSQVVDYGITTEEADAHAQALMDQWGVGRKGFDDGLVILFDLDPSLEHGQVQLYGGPGYRAAFLDNSEKQRVYEQEMLPLLRVGDMDGALLIALQRVDENATPEHAATLERARFIDAAVGLVGAPIILLGLVGSAVFAWLRYGRDPVYLDDPSVHMAGPPEGLTPAAGTFVLNGGPSRRALTVAMLDLASRGLLAFREEHGLFGMNRKVGIDLAPPPADDITKARQAINAVRPLGPAEQLAYRELGDVTTEVPNFIDPKELLAFGPKVGSFDKALESHTMKMGWFRERPSAATSRWMVRGTIAIVIGVIALIGAFNLPSGGLTLIGGALIIGAIVVFVLARSMVSVSLPGAMIRAMLAAYRRTLEKTMAQARSMDQVVAEAGFPWLETPDQAVVWGTALGLEKEVEEVLERSMTDLKEGRAAVGSTYMPVWFGASGGDGGGGAPATAGLFSSSAVPNIGGMMATLSSIGNSPSSSGSGGGGFGGGGSGGGGGGSGGGF
ncbi:MAG TPA: TPM domain-containing protein [Candidatus Limnocylindrales bacterium]|nr:TPM domain-containing protein [Candidatus Limnocylindrales bacterium]